MECQVDKKEHFGQRLLFAFNRSAKATEATRYICEVYGEDAMPRRNAQNWFKRFKGANFILENMHRTGCESSTNCLIGTKQ